MAEGIRVLHVDDEPGFADVTADYLEREDNRFVVDTATSASEGLERLDDDIECVISDYDMPTTNGLELLASVREEYPDLPFILFTGKGSEEVASDAISAGVTDYLRKRTGTEQYDLLANRIETAVGQHRAERELERQSDLFAKVQDLANVGAWEYYPQEETGSYSEGVYEIYGIDSRPERDPGRDIEEFYHPDDQETIREVFRAAVEAGESYDIEVRVIDANGTEKWVRTRGEPQFEDGTCVRVRGTIKDITERKKREERLAMYVDDAGDILIICDEEGRWQYVSPAIERIIGYDPETLLGETAFSYVHPDDRERVQASFLELVGSDSMETSRVEYRFERPDGSYLWLESVVTDRSESPLDGYVVTTRDITARKQREQELERYKHLVEHTPELILVLDEELEVQYQSPPSPELAIDPRPDDGENPLEHIYEEDISDVIQDIQHVRENPAEIATTEYRAKDADGNWQWFENRTQNYLDSYPIDGILVTVREATDRKEAQRQLADYSETLEQLQETTQTLLGATGRDEAVDLVIAGLENALSFDLAGLWLATEKGEALEPAALTAASRELFEEPPTYTPDGDSLPWDAYESQRTRVVDDVDDQRRQAEAPLSSELLVPVGTYGLLTVGATESGAFTDRDILLVELWADTARVVLDRIERERQLRARERELVAERDRLDEFVGFVSHDLRNPLDVAMTRLELARADCSSEHLDQITDALDRMEALIDDMLELARTNEQATELQALDIDSLVYDCWGTIETAEATLETETHRRIVADESQLKQLLENLVRNAIDHAGEDVTVTIGELAGGFYVEDDGPGIPADQREEIFDAGFSTKEEGTGFGLRIIERIADAHGWEVDATEAEDGGARFEFTGVEFV